MKVKSKNCVLSVILLLSFLVSVNVLPVHSQPSVSFKVTRVVWGEDPDNPIKAYPGDTGTSLTVEVQNLSPNETIKGVTAVLMLDDPFADIYGNRNATATGEPAIGEILNPTDEILPKGFFTLTFSLDIDSNALPRSYSYDMTVNYSVNCTGTFEEGEPQNLTVEFVVSKIESTVTCSISPVSVEKSETVDVSGSIDPAQENVTVTLTYKRPDGSTSSANVRTNAEGSYRDSCQPDVEGSWSVNASWLGDERHKGDWALASFEVRLAVSLSVVTSSNRLTGGLDNKFNVTLLNNGGVPLSTIDVTLGIPSPLIVHGDNQWTFEYLEVGNSTLIAVEIYAPTSSIGTTYSGSLNLNYRDDYGESHSNSHPVGLIIRGQIELVVYGTTVSPLPARPGSKVSITATILNKGNVAARYVNASITPSSVLGLTSESTAYVGEVEENSPAPFTLAANVDTSLQDGTFPVTISVTYRDDQYVDHSLNTTLYLIVEKPEGDVTDSGGVGGFLGPLSEVALVLLTLVGALIAVVLLYRRHLHRQSKTKLSRKE